MLKLLIYTFYCCALLFPLNMETFAFFQTWRDKEREREKEMNE